MQGIQALLVDRKDKKSGWWRPEWTDDWLSLHFLRHPAAHSDHWRVAELEPSQLYIAFLEDEHSDDVDDPRNACVTLREGVGITARPGRYPLIRLGKLPKRAHVRTQRKPINIAAHRLVNWIIRGAPTEHTGFYTIHSCHNKECVKPAHLSWDSQEENLRQSRVVQTGKKAERSGALLFGHLCMPIQLGCHTTVQPLMQFPSQQRNASTDESRQCRCNC